MEGVEQTKVKYILTAMTTLNIDLGNNNKRQDYKIDTVKGVLVGGKRVNEGDEGEGIWLVNFIYLYEIEQ
jgi:hypothetical protein